MKIRFKSVRKDWESNKDDFIFDFTSELIREKEDDGFISLTFDEIREGKKITNRIEYNEKVLRIFSGVTSLTCELNQITENILRVNGVNKEFIIYTKMYESKIEDNYLEFKYLICNNNEFKDNFTSIHLELFIMED